VCLFITVSRVQRTYTLRVKIRPERNSLQASARAAQDVRRRARGHIRLLLRLSQVIYVLYHFIYIYMYDRMQKQHEHGVECIRTSADRSTAVQIERICSQRSRNSIRTHSYISISLLCNTASVPETYQPAYTAAVSAGDVHTKIQQATSRPSRVCCNTSV
jgi:hypothetical protein